MSAPIFMPTFTPIKLAAQAHDVRAGLMVIDRLISDAIDHKDDKPEVEEITHLIRWCAERALRDARQLIDALDEISD